MDNRKKYTKQVKMLVFFIVGLLLGAAINSYINREKWEDQQVDIGLNTLGVISPLAQNPFDLEVAEAKQPEPILEPEMTVEDKIRLVFEDDAEDALKIAKCESGLRADAWNENTNGSVDVGVFQINSVHGIRAKWLLNDEVNIRVAKQIFDEQGGWHAWVCKKVL